MPAARTHQRPQHQVDLFARAVSAMAAMTGKPLLYGPNNKPLVLKPSAAYTFRRDAARKTGSLKNWNPQRVFGKQAEALERREIVKRSIDLSLNDPHAAGVIDTFASTVIGAGLTPHPVLDPDVFDFDPDTARLIQAQQRAAWQTWTPFADAAGRMTFGQIQYLAKVCMMRYGEFFVLLPMINDPARPFSLACQVIHPMRVKTPTDKIGDPRIRDGIELGKYGQAVAVWVKKTSPTSIARLTSTSANFVRVPVKKGHRWQILHGFVQKEPEQVRGWPFFTPAMKYFRDFNDLLNAELVSNVVTAALSYFIEVTAGTDPFNLAERFATDSDTVTDMDGNDKTLRYEETYPGRIMYGNPGEKPHLLAANRPGTTFEPFTRTVKKSIAMALNMPYPVLFKDVEGVNFAGFRSAMLDAWRVFSMEREWFGAAFCQPIFTMIQEEAYLRGRLDVADFYTNMHALTRCSWRGAPKGDIEPIKAVKSDILAINAGLKTRTEALAERNRDFRSVVEELAEEQDLIRDKGLSIHTAVDAGADEEDPEDNQDGDN